MVLMLLGLALAFLLAWLALSWIIYHHGGGPRCSV